MRYFANNRTYKILIKSENIFTFFIILSSFMIVEYFVYINATEYETFLYHVIKKDSIFALIISFIFLYLLVFYKSSSIIQSKTKLNIKVFISSIMTYAIGSFLILITSYFKIDQVYFITVMFCSTILIMILKNSMNILLHGKFKIKLLLIGPKSEAEKLAVKIVKNQIYYDLKYILYECENTFSNVQRIVSLIEEVDEVYITNKLGDSVINNIIAICFDLNKPFSIVPELYELTITNAKIDQVEDSLIYKISSLRFTLSQRFLKRSFDVLLSFSLLVSTLPIMILAMILLKLEDPNLPVIFIQERLTRNNKKFKLIKFRTMRNDAELETGPILSYQNDPRITKVGRILRKLRIDELPQVFNILKSEMSFVGPRPERDHFVQKYVAENPNYRYRMNVKAGLTGLAQSLGKYNSSFSDKLSYDIYYISTYTFMSDLKIILYTIKAVIDGTTEINIDDDPLTLKDVLKDNEILLETDSTIQLYTIVKDFKYEK